MRATAGEAGGDLLGRIDIHLLRSIAHLYPSSIEEQG
jgi:hypothetical protein